MVVAMVALMMAMMITVMKIASTVMFMAMDHGHEAWPWSRLWLWPRRPRRCRTQLVTDKDVKWGPRGCCNNKGAHHHIHHMSMPIVHTHCVSRNVHRARNTGKQVGHTNSPQARSPAKTQHGVEVCGAWRGVAMGTVDGVLRAMAVAKPAINSHRNKCRMYANTRAYVFNMQHSLRAHAVAHTVTLRITHGMR